MRELVNEKSLMIADIKKNINDKIVARKNDN